MGSEEILNTKSGLPHAKLIDSALTGLAMKQEMMESRLAGAKPEVREDIQAEMDTINWFHTAVLYWQEHGKLEAVLAYYKTNRVDK